MSMEKFVLLLLVGLVAGRSPKPTVKIAQGILQGTWEVSTDGRTFASFQGIPYARPPVGKYRFREPQELKPWAGVWDATKPLSPCLQYDPFIRQLQGSENCLYLNVHTPELNRTASLPVLVFIHGGAFMYGSGGLYGPANIMDRDMVVVTLNYRLGPLGFLSTGDEAAPGNAGLKDQAFALRWVKENIILFGGNPDSVTLTGCSAGGASVHYHFLSPLSKGNFARAIAFSGSAFASWTHAVKPAQKARTLATIVGCPTTSNKEMIDCLKYRPAEVLVNAQLEMFDWKVHMFTPFTPTVEGPRVREPFLSQYPYQAAKSGAMHNVPLMTSVTSEEGLYPGAVYQTDPELLLDLENNWERLASSIFEYNDTLPLERRPAVAAAIKNHYLQGQPVGQDTFPQLIQALGDRLFAADVGRMAQVHSAKSGQPVYVYRYSYRGRSSLSELMSLNKENYGVSHADDVLLMFKFPEMEAKVDSDVKMLHIMLDMVYSYASTGVPKVPYVKWTPVKPGAKDLNYLEIASPSQLTMKSHSDFGQKAFWDSQGFMENENYNYSIRDEL